MKEKADGGGGLVAKSCLTLATPWTAACQAPLSIGFFRQEYWSGLPFPSPGDLPNPGIEPGSSALQADSLLTELQGKTKKRLLGLKWSGNGPESNGFYLGQNLHIGHIENVNTTEV